jgi:putative endonuclease
LRGWRPQGRGGSNPPFRTIRLARLDSLLARSWQAICPCESNGVPSDRSIVSKSRGTTFDSLAWTPCSLAHGRPCFTASRMVSRAIDRPQASRGAPVPYVYLLRCSDGMLYPGHTNDLDSRLEAHNQGTASEYTAKRRPVKIVYSERHSTLGDAVARERQLKCWSAEKKEALAAGDLSRLKSLRRCRR